MCDGLNGAHENKTEMVVHKTEMGDELNGTHENKTEIVFQKGLWQYLTNCPNSHRVVQLRLNSLNLLLLFLNVTLHPAALGDLILQNTN